MLEEGLLMLEMEEGQFKPLRLDFDTSWLCGFRQAV